MGRGSQMANWYSKIKIRSANPLVFGLLCLVLWDIISASWRTGVTRTNLEIFRRPESWRVSAAMGGRTESLALAIKLTNYYLVFSGRRPPLIRFPNQHECECLHKRVRVLSLPTPFHSPPQVCQAYQNQFIQLGHHWLSLQEQS